MSGNRKTLYHRFDFDSYASTREFLDRLADLSERCGFYPNVDFGTTYVRIGIEAADQDRLTETGSAFVAEMEQLTRQGEG
ncbi:MAG TPA: hypothetical protein VFO01_06730 [Trebonia sp.]|nr:hypothetical protein [Trebonia sp.]